MTATAVQPTAASTRIVVGPVFTAAGFKYWYLICLPDCVVAVPQGFWTGIMLAVAGNVGVMMFGLVGGLLSRKGSSMRARLEAQIPHISDSQLRARPNNVIPISLLRAITFKGEKFANAPNGALIAPDIILERKGGNKHKFGISGPDFKRSSELLRQMYPTLCKSV